MRKKTRSQLIATAYHEAGHAVMALHLGFRIGSQGVSIVPQSERNGHSHLLLHLGVQHTNQREELSDRVRLRLERRIMVAMAGEMTQRALAPKSLNRWHASSDRDTENFFARRMCQSPAEESALLVLLRIRARQIVGDFRFQMKAIEIARTLVEKKSLTPAEIAAAISSLHV